MKFLIVLPLVAVVLSGCATSDQRTVEAVNTLPRNQQPAYLASQRDKGAITQARYQDMMAQWTAHKQAEDDEKAALASMTPKERAEYRLKKESLELQRQQVDAAYAQADATSTGTWIGAMNQADANQATRSAATQVSTAVSSR